MTEKEDEEFPLLGKDTIEDHKNPRVQESGLFSGTYTMLGMSLDIRIKKSFKIKQGTYDIMKSFQHNSLVPNLHYYAESGQGRLVIPLIGNSFENWISTIGLELLIDQKGNMTSLFRTIMLDICDLLQKLLVAKISIKNLGIDNLYMADEVTPRILILVTEAEAQANEVSKISTWGPVRTIVDFCYEKCKREMTSNARRFRGFIGSDNFTVNALKSYPENWDDHTKGEYLVALIASDLAVTKARLKHTTIMWPLVEQKIPDVLIKITESGEKNGHYYRLNIPFDYILLIRDVYKHFNTFDTSIKEQLGSTKEAFLKKLQDWTPTVWQDIYDVIGWP